MSNCRANRGRGRAGGRHKKALCTAYGSLVVSPPIRIRAEAKAAGSFCEFHLNKSWSSWRVPRRDHPHLPLDPRARLVFAKAYRSFHWLVSLGGTRGRMSVYMFHAHFRSSRRNNTVSSHTATSSPSIGTPLYVLAVLAASKFTQRRVSGS